MSEVKEKVAAKSGDKQKAQLAIVAFCGARCGCVVRVKSVTPSTELLQTPLTHSDSICSNAIPVGQLALPVHVYSSRSDTPR